MATRTTSRNGKHKDGKVSIGMYVTEDFRALLALLVDLTGETATDIMMDGVRARARQVGVLTESGNVSSEYIGSIAVIKAVFSQKKKGKRND